MHRSLETWESFGTPAFPYTPPSRSLAAWCVGLASVVMELGQLKAHLLFAFLMRIRDPGLGFANVAHPAFTRLFYFAALCRSSGRGDVEAALGGTQ